MPTWVRVPVSTAPPAALWQFDLDANQPLEPAAYEVHAVDSGDWYLLTVARARPEYNLPEVRAWQTYLRCATCGSAVAVQLPDDAEAWMKLGAHHRGIRALHPGSRASLEIA